MFTPTTVVILVGMFTVLIIVLVAIFSGTPLSASFHWFRGAMVRIGISEVERTKVQKKPD